MTWKVLAVDDQKFILQLISFSLSDYDVTTLSCGTDTLQTIETLDKAGQLGWLALVILDIMMPEVSGLDLLVQIRQKYPDLSVMMCSALSTSDSVNQALQLGATDYIVKPVNGTVLREKVAKAVRRRQTSLAVSGSIVLNR